MDGQYVWVGGSKLIDVLSVLAWPVRPLRGPESGSCSLSTQEL